MNNNEGQDGRVLKRKGYFPEQARRQDGRVLKWKGYFPAQARRLGSDDVIYMIHMIYIDVY